MTQKKKDTFLTKLKSAPLSYAIILILLFAGVAYLIRSQQASSEDHNFTTFMLSVDRIEQSLDQMEGANNGFLLTGNDDFRANFTIYRDTLSDNYQQIADQVTNNPVQSDHLNVFKARLTEWFALYNPMIISRRNAGQNGQPTANRLRKEQDNLNKARLLFNEMLALLREVRSERTYQASALKSPDGTWFFQIFDDQDDASNSVDNTRAPES